MKKILIVEDDSKMTKILVEALRKENFETLEATDGKEGLEIALKAKPDLILLDIIMPVMDGLEMLHKLKAKDEGKDITVIVLTNSNDLNKMAEAIEKGISSYIVKSDFTLNDLIRKVKEILK